MESLRKPWLIAAAALIAPLAAVAAQQPPGATAMQRQVDSLATELRRLQARFDSVLAVLVRLQTALVRTDTAIGAARADSAAMVDELASLRAAAAAAAGQPDAAEFPEAARVDSARIRELGGRPRNLSQLNPELSVTADIRAYTRQAGSGTDSFDPREFEFSFQSAVDPYSYTKIFVSVETICASWRAASAASRSLPDSLPANVAPQRDKAST